MGSPGAQAPARLGRYELMARLATGGMGEIFLARLEGAAGFEKLFVVKRILPHLADDARFRAMLIAEARIASKMSHANICQVYELGETDGQLYIVMEYLEGITLLPLLRKCSKEQTPLDYGFIGGILQQATDALHYAHELSDRGGESFGIVHRDVTPSNVFLTDSGVVKLLDFGIAKVKDASAHTQTGTVKGKYAYMAPEQLRGANVDRRADVFALGVVTFEMLALRRLFQRKTDYLTFRAVMEQPIPDVRRYRADVPDALAEVLNRTLDRDPDHRAPTARQLGSMLLDALGKRPWSQGELGDFVRGSFADEIHKKSAEVAQAIHRTNPAGQQAMGRTTMPLIVQDGEAELDEEEEFPSVESTESDAPPAQMLRHPNQDFQGGTPPPFEPLRSHSKRSFVWPVLAMLAVAVAVVALVLVFRQMNQEGPPPIVNITATPVEMPVVQAPEPVEITPPKGPVKPAKKASLYDVAIQQHRTQILACAKEHGAPPNKSRVVIVIAASGKPKTVSLEPAKLNTTPLGACIKHVLSVALFPTTKDEMQVAFALTKSS